ncbi:hypothetical protein SAMN05216489_09959 [Streptomyces sp. 3213]|uniref:hypothetical protein n=1 Tax=Streptomyces sp. 3213.3 TaxID=1855348 RepID=UPI0008970102|nr:hypothetical protein [Streptomyces sp. 3213.3]SEF04783.1 hypothetical protein SAMN05216489_09959 [Streptomyces sp. 3213] [Streptomyces sp. 3213.3]
MKVLVSDEVHVDSGQVFVKSGGDDCDLYDAFAGQEGVGLCGAAMGGMLFLLTGLRFGGVRFTVELHDNRPALDETWEEIVEVPFRPVSEETELRQWNGGASWDLGLEQRDYRARYCAVGMDAGNSKNVREEDEPQTDDQYLLQFWPAPPEPARVFKQTSRQAANWHAFATSPVG